MPTHDRSERATVDNVHHLAETEAFRPCGDEDQISIGIELETFVIQRTADGLRRLPIEGEGLCTRAVLDELATSSSTDGIIAPHAGDPARDGYPLHDGGALTFEPGGQLEYASAVAPTAATMLDQLDATFGMIADRFREEDCVVANAGLDPWTADPNRQLQIDKPRYRAMLRWFPAIGRAMMYDTTALQLSLDPGRGEDLPRRWAITNLLAPLGLASFACGPVPAPDIAVSGRARMWRNVAPTRTGFPQGVIRGRPHEPHRQFSQFVLSADVLYIRTQDEAVPGMHGWTFREWIRDGHPELGWPTTEDVREHMTLVFPEVRPRGAFELRTLDGVPWHLRGLITVLYSGAVYDPVAREAILDILEPSRAMAAAQLVKAGEVGLKDPLARDQAMAVWGHALEGAKRLPKGYHRQKDLDAAVTFLDEFTAQGRCPADHLRDLLAKDPQAALDWCIEGARR